MTINQTLPADAVWLPEASKEFGLQDKALRRLVYERRITSVRRLGKVYVLRSELEAIPVEVTPASRPLDYMRDHIGAPS
jgi:hypothetical protein